MSQENVAIVEALFRAWDRRDPEAALALVDPEVEIDMTGAAASQLDFGPDRGHEGLARVVSAFVGAWEDLRWTPETFIDAGDHVVVWLGASARGRVSGVPVETRFACVYTLRGGRVVAWRGYDTLAAAAASVGI
jgi:ketosteroid isomerase-like protein